VLSSYDQAALMDLLAKNNGTLVVYLNGAKVELKSGVHFWPNARSRFS
jgi:hypothetical protein